MSNYFTSVVVAICMACALNACSMYRPDLSQGNHIENSSLEHLKPGMSKHEVQDIMGTTALTPVINLNDWHYTYAFVDGQHRDQKLKYKTITLHFNKDKLESYTSTDWTLSKLPRAKAQNQRKAKN